ARIEARRPVHFRDGADAIAFFVALLASPRLQRDDARAQSLAVAAVHHVLSHFPVAPSAAAARSARLRGGRARHGLPSPLEGATAGDGDEIAACGVAVNFSARAAPGPFVLSFRTGQWSTPN